MTKCVFCGREEHSFKGLHLIKNDGSVNFFCSSKCRKNLLKLGRDKRRLKWTLAYREEREKAAISHKIEEDKKSAAVNKKDESKKAKLEKQAKKEVKDNY